MLAYLVLATIKLDSLTARGVVDGKTYHCHSAAVSDMNGEEQAPEINELTRQILLSLSILQGVALSHPPSKAFMGRKCSLEASIPIGLVSVTDPCP